MNASAFLVFFIAAILALVSAGPAYYTQLPKVYMRVQEENPFSVETETEDLDGKGLRFQRATCDLLSFSTPFGSLNHSACAAHCLTKRYKGGRCVNGICRCRR